MIPIGHGTNPQHLSLTGLGKEEGTVFHQIDRPSPRNYSDIANKRCNKASLDALSTKLQQKYSSLTQAQQKLRDAFPVTDSSVTERDLERAFETLHVCIPQDNFQTLAQVLYISWYYSVLNLLV